MTILRETDLTSTTGRVLRPAQTAALVGVTGMTLTRWEKAGLFPRRFKLVPNSGPFGAVGHDYAEVMQWLAERRNSRGAVAA